VVVPSTPVRVASYPAGADFGPRDSVDFEFVWILRGSATWRTVGEAPVELALRPGVLALARPGLTDSYRWDPAEETVHGYVHFAVPDRGPLPPPSDWPLVRETAPLPVLDALCRYLVDLTADDAAADDDRAAHLLATALELFVRGPVRPATTVPPVVAAFLQQVRQRWGGVLDPIPVPALAGACGVSAGHLFRVFRETYGLGPARALEVVRLARAATLLQRSNATLTEVAHRCGFANPYHFSRRFTAWYGRPPGAYRALGESADPYEPARSTGLLPVVRALLD
jgi:AraC-like DNA-binding protein